MTEIFERTSGSSGDEIERGDIGVYLSNKDCTSECKKYLMLTGNRKGEEVNLRYDHFKKVFPLPEKIPISIDGKTTEISRESAVALKKALNDIGGL